MVKKRRKLTKELAISEAKKYEYRSDFKKKEPNLYKMICRNKWFDEAFGHMLFKPKMWTKEECYEAASKCETRAFFCKEYPGAYKSSKIHGWFDDICEKNFKVVGNRAQRCIYAYEFPDKTVYVGLTGNIKQRDSQHKNDTNSQVYKHINETGTIPTLKQLTDYLFYEDAAKLEGEFLKKYIDEGWTKLNKIATGGLGTTIEPRPKIRDTARRKRWSNEQIIERAKAYQTRKDFAENEPSLYCMASKRKILDEACAHMALLQRRKWTKEEAQNEALKYKERGEFEKNAHGCYLIAMRKGWLNDICKHMNSGYERLKKYNKKNVIETLGQYKTMQELRKSNDVFVRGCYWWLKKQKLLIEYKKYLKHD